MTRAETDLGRMMGVYGGVWKMHWPTVLRRWIKTKTSLREKPDVLMMMSSDANGLFLNTGFFHPYRPDQKQRRNTTNQGPPRRRISFQDHVQVREIPSCNELDDATKRGLWYTREEFSLMRRNVRRGIA